MYVCWCQWKWSEWGGSVPLFYKAGYYLNTFECPSGRGGRQVQRQTATQFIKCVIVSCPALLKARSILVNCQTFDAFTYANLQSLRPTGLGGPGSTTAPLTVDAEPYRYHQPARRTAGMRGCGSLAQRPSMFLRCS